MTTHVPEPATTGPSTPETDSERDADAVSRRVLRQLPVLIELLAAVEDPLERARAATGLLAEVEQVRLGLADARRTAVAETGLGARGLERGLGISLGAAADLYRAAAGGPRRRTR